MKTKVLHGIACFFERALQRRKLMRIVFVFVNLTYYASHAQQWQLVNPAYPTSDIWVSGFSVRDFGATGDGVTDVTSSFQKGMDTLGKIGGGTLFVPGGKYVIKGSLLIPKGVILRGEWEKPVKGQPVKGTILMAYTGRGNESAAAFITMQPTAGIQDLSIWYPEQDPNNITPYSPTILYGQTGYWGNDFCNADNITFVNAYSGLVLSRVNGGGCPMMNGLYGTPLSRGIEIDNIADVGHIENIDFSPDYWAGSGLPGAPAPNSGYKTWILNNGTGIVMRRNDWSYTSFVQIDGYNIGFYAGPSIASAGSIPNGQNYKLTFSNCKTGILCDVLNSVGILFSKVTTINCQTGVKVSGGASTKGALQIFSSTIGGVQNAIFTDTSCLANIVVERSNISSGNVMINGGTLVASSNNFQNSAPQIALGTKSRGIITGNTYQYSRSIQNNSQYICKVDDSPITLAPLPQFPEDYNGLTRSQKPTRAAMYLATAAPYNAVADGVTDNTTAVQNALNQAATDGGGIVFLPPGKYKFTGHLSIPPGVELKGATDDYSAPKAQGSILEPYADKGNPSGTPFIVMNPFSGIRGLTINYPEQLASNIPNVPAYPYTIQVKGNNVYIVNIGLRAVYDGIDLFTYKCDNHFINNLTGHIFDNGIRVGGNSMGGLIANAQFNSGDYANGAESKWGSWPNSPTNGTTDSYNYNFNNTDFLKLGNCTNQTLYNNFVFGVRNGLIFMNDNNNGASGISYGTGIDGARTSIRFETLGSGGFDMFNSQIVALGPDTSYSYIETVPGFNSTINMVNSDFWGGAGKSFISNGNGRLNLEAANFQSTGTVRFANLNSNGNISFKNSFIAHNNNMLLPQTEVHLYAESGVMDVNGIDTTKMPLYKNILGTNWAVSLNGALSRTGWKAWANVNTGGVQNALDSNITTRWATNGPQVNGQFYAVDMKTNNTIRSIVLDQSTSTNDFPAAYAVYISTDSSNFGPPVATGTGGASGTTVISFPDVIGRFIKIIQTSTKSNYWSIYEFYAFGKVNVDSIKLNKKTSSLTIGNSDTLHTTFYPGIATIKSAIWSTNNPSVAVVDTNGIVTAISAGTAVIKASSSDGNKIDSSTVIVSSLLMPVKFKNVSAELISNIPKKVLIRLYVEEEHNVDHYSVERSADGKSFNEIQKLKPTGSTYYSYIDNDNTATEKNYYRIKAADIDGTSENSNTVSVSLSSDNSDNVSVYPNPITNSNFKIKFSSIPDGATYNLAFFNSLGTQIYKTSLNTSSGSKEYSIDLGSNKIMAGYYILRITSMETGLSINKKIEILK